MRLPFTLLIALAFAGSAVADQVPETPLLTGPNFQQVPASDILVLPTGGTVTTLGDALATSSGNLTNGTVIPTGATIAQTLGTLTAQQGVLLDAFRSASDPDDTLSMSRAVAANVAIILGPKTYTINNYVMSGTPTNFVLRGTPGKSIIQRTSASGSHFFYVTATNVVIDGVTFDSNKASVTANQWGVYLGVGGQNALVSHCVFKNNSGTVGDGFALVSTGPAAGGSFNFSDNEVTGNTGQGARFGSVAHGVVSRNYAHDNTAVGISVGSFLTASSTNYATDIIVSDNRVARSVLGIVAGGWPAPFVFAFPSAVSVKVSGNQLLDNSTYGIAGGGDYLDISDNMVSQSAPGVTVFGGIDGLARYSSVHGNVVTLSGSPWGIDYGGSVQMTITSNHVTMTSGIAINAGGNQNSHVTNNHLILSSTATGINVYNVDGSGAANGTFPTLSSGSVYADNTIDLGGPSNSGIVIADNAGAGTGASPNSVTGNHFNICGTCSASQGVVWNGPPTAVQIKGNDWGGSTLVYRDVNGSGDVVFDPVYLGGTISGISSTTAIRSINLRTTENFSNGQSILYVNPTSTGSGYTSATTLAANGTTGGSGWAGTANIWQGQIIGVHTTAVGSGYTGTITVAATDSGGGTGAVFAVGSFPRLPITAEMKYQANATTVLKIVGGGTSLNIPAPLQLSSQVAVYLAANANGNGLSWDVVNYTLPTFAIGSMPTCNATSSGAQINVTGSVSGKWQARCDATNWVAPDGVTIN
jgi:hypothetical protein